MAGSASYAKELEERLKDRVFEGIFPQFAEGFIRHRWGEIPPQQEDLDEVYQATLTFLYRLMFLLYAEARDLLPVKEAHGYGGISLRSITGEIAERAGLVLDAAPEKLRGYYSASDTTLYDHLTRLFEVVDRGDAAMNVPNYNGGLFMTAPADNDTGADAANARFLRDTKIPDRYLALGLDRLARDLGASPGEGLVFIDYKSLGVRQLGSIYEGLLEFKLRVAPEKMAIVAGKRTEEIVPYKKAKKKDILTTGRGDNKQERTLSKGAVYLENNKQERKATGSYYTPDYIVSYIVEHTVGPVLDEKFTALTPRLRKAEEAYYGAVQNNKAKAKAGMDTQPPDLVWNREDMQQLAADVLDVKVLDPAMGSGHFLVEVVDYVTDRTLQYLDRFRHNPVTAQLQRVRSSIEENMDDQGVSIDTGRLTDVNLLKRQVLKRCVYGVDLNRMAVELAKVSLWLDAFTLGAPLSFLDHHLRWGNSLIGTMARDADRELRGEGGQLSLFSGPFVGLLQAAKSMEELSLLSDATIQEAHKSANLFNSFEKFARPYKQMLDIFVIQHFGVKHARDFLDNYGADAVNTQRDKLKPVYQTVLNDRAQLYDEYRFFHWDLEFPEVFIDLSRAEWKENAGFDAVVGNPPYISVTNIPDDERPYYLQRFETAVGRFDMYIVFMQKSIELLRRGGIFSFIVPVKFCVFANGKPLRKMILENHKLEVLIDISQCEDVFDEPSTYPSIPIVKKEKPDTNETLNVIKADNKSAATFLTLVDDILAKRQKGIPVAELLQTPDYIVSPSVNGDIWQTLQSFRRRFTTIGEVYAIEQAIRIGSKKTREKVLLSSAQKHGQKSIVRPMLDGGEVDRYSVQWEGNYLLYDREQLYNPKTPAILDRPKIMLKRVANVLSAGFDTGEHPDGYFYPLNTIYVFYPSEELEISERYILSLINSKLLDWVYRVQYEAIGIRGGYIEFRENVQYLPVATINFNTQDIKRTNTVRELVSNYDTGNYDQVLAAVQKELGSSRTDTVHDLLAHLAGMMIDLNKDKQAEIGQFLTWLEGQIGAQVDDLSGKTIIRGYLGDYQKDEPETPFDDVLDQLTKSANRRKMSVDIRNATVQQRIREEYEKSLDTLRPVKARLAETDALIDQIVYALYGLTEEEIVVVEGRS